MAENNAKLKISNPKNVASFEQTFAVFLQLLAQFTPSNAALANIAYASHSTELVNGRTITVVTITIPNGAERDFCQAVMAPESDPLVNSVSEHGLLGFSPVQGDRLDTPWNMAIFETCYVPGSDRMKTFQLQGLQWFSKRELPLWLQLASFAAGTCIQVSFISTIVSSGRLGAASLIAVREAQRNSRISWVGQATEAGTALLRGIAKENEKAFSEDDYKRETAEAITHIRSSTAEVCRLMEGMTQAGGDGERQWDSDLPKIFQTLYNITFRAYTAFSLSEELMNHYFRIAIVHGAAAVSSAVSTAACSVQLYLLLEARRAIPEIAKSLMPGVLSAASGVVFGVGSTIYHGVKAAKAHKKKIRCEQLAHLLQHIWEAAAEANTMIRWVKTTSGTTVVFVHDSSREWETFLVSLKGASQVQEEWKQPEFVIRWLNRRRVDLEGLSKDLETQWEGIWT